MKNHNYNLVLELGDVDKRTYSEVVREISNLENIKPNKTYVIKYIDDKVHFEIRKWSSTTSFFSIYSFSKKYGII